MNVQALSNFAIPVLFIGMFYFLMIRPQQKRDKQLKEMRASLSVGDEITTIGGVIGKIVTVNEDSVVIETGENSSRITFDKSGIARIKS